MYEYLLSRHLYDYCKDQLQIMNLLKKTAQNLSIRLISLTTSRNEVIKFLK